MGVRQRSSGKYQVSFRFNGERIYLGTFDTELKAKRAENKWKREHQEAIQEAEQIGYKPDNDEGFDFLGRPLQKKPTLVERVKNAYRSIRSNTSTEK